MPSPNLFFILFFLLPALLMLDHQTMFVLIGFIMAFGSLRAIARWIHSAPVTEAAPAVEDPDDETDTSTFAPLDLAKHLISILFFLYCMWYLKTDAWRFLIASLILTHGFSIGQISSLHASPQLPQVMSRALDTAVSLITLIVILVTVVTKATHGWT